MIGTSRQAILSDVAPFLPGINYPWTMFQGRPNYGCDFGRNAWGSHAGVSVHPDEIGRDFDVIASMGLEVVRWFVFTDGRGGITWDDEGRPTGLSDGFFDDMDAALEAARDHRLRVCLVLFDYSWMIRRALHDDAGALVFVQQPDLLATEDGRGRLLDRVLVPWCERYGALGPKADLGSSVHSIDVINEPDWVTRGLALSSFGGSEASGGIRAFSRAELRAFVGDVSDLVHRHTSALVTVGGARVRYVGEWDDPAYGLDFLQVHSYPDVSHPRRDLSLIGRPCATFGLSKPLLIGEHPANGDRCHPDGHHPPAFSLSDYLDLARDGGYLGAWPWSFNGVDDFKAVDAAAMRSWLEARGANA